jgi:FkbM family methyltransferase
VAATIVRGKIRFKSGMSMQFQSVKTMQEVSARRVKQFRPLAFLSPDLVVYIYNDFFRLKPLRRMLHGLVKKFIPTSINLYGVTVLLNQNDAVVSGSLALGCYETRLLAYFAAEIKPGMFVVDVGANIGLYALVAAKLVGDSGVVLAVEPCDENISFVRRSAELNGLQNVTLVQEAVGDKAGEAALFINNENLADHRIFQDGDRAYKTVMIRPLDAIVEAVSSRPVDIIKIDIQGAEDLAINGIRRVLLKNPSAKVFMEFWPWGITKAGGSPQRVLDGIQSCNFSILQFSNRAGKFIEVTEPASLLAMNKERQHANLLLVKKGD